MELETCRRFFCQVDTARHHLTPSGETNISKETVEQWASEGEPTVCSGICFSKIEHCVKKMVQGTKVITVLAQNLLNFTKLICKALLSHFLLYKLYNDGVFSS